MKILKKAFLPLLMMSLWNGCQHEPTPSPQASPAPLTSPSAAPGNQSTLPGAAAATVRVKEIGAQDITLERDYTAHIMAAQEVDVRSRAEGNLLSFNFREGSAVSAGQILFQLDPRPLQASVSAAQAKVQEARANLSFSKNRVNWKKAKADQAQAEANLANQQREVDRYKPLMQRAIIPKQLYDQTVSARDVAQAQLDAAKAEVENTGIRDTSSIAKAEADLSLALANLENAQLSLEYTTIEAPISGVIGELNVNPGNLVRPGEAVLATISSTNPIYVEFSISEQDYLKLVRQRQAGVKNQGDRVFQLILADGKAHPHPGRFELIDRAVDAATGSIKVRTSFPNPDGSLRPGEFVNLRLNSKDLPQAIMVPQRAVMELQSSNFVYLVDKDHKIVQREITLGNRYQSSFIVEKGLNAGDRVVVDGGARVKPGMVVSIEEAN